jgi:response regulator RpfG family c-di-GMP phosphodiesterase
MIEIGNQEKPKVLIVDDETEVLESLADLLRKDFHIFATSDVEEAQDLLVSHNMFSLVISDQRMPVLTGAELLARVAKTSPDTARILLTGYADIDVVIEAVNQGQIVHYITKPWDTDKLLAILKPIAERHLLLLENRQLVQQLFEINTFSKDSAEQIETLKKTRSTIESENQILKTAYEQLDKSFWHLRKIQEVLPICMECGKVKTSDSSWEDVVNFLKNNSMFLSHGYCPDCEKKLFFLTKNHRIKKRSASCR